MRVLLAVPDSHGCGHYRVMFPGAAVEMLGHEVSLNDSIPVRIELTPQDQAKIVHVEVDPEEIDLVVFCRPLRQGNLEMLEVLQSKGVAVAVDIDDDFSCIDRQHKFWRHHEPAYNPRQNRQILAKCCAKADLVLCTTPALAKRYGHHGRVAVLPNCVPEGYLSIGDLVEKQPGVIGWPGHTEVHPNDLQVTFGGVADAVRSISGARFVNVGSGTDVAKFLGLEEDELEVRGPYVEFDDYPWAIAQFQVGIVPLADTQFNAAKSGLKGLELASVGVPFVASPVADYRRLAAEGIGWLAKDRGRNWAGQIKRLLGPEGEAAAARALEAVRENHTYERQGWRWAEAYEAAIANAKKRCTRVQAAALL